jgi:hypothetical protein
LMRSDPMTSGGRVQLNTDLSASAMSDLYFRTARFLPTGGDIVCL